MIGRLLLLAAGVALLSLLLDWRLLDLTPEEPTAETARPGYYLTGVELQDFGSDGRARFELKAAAATEEPGTGRVALADVVLDWRAAESPQAWHLTAAGARVNAGGEIVDFEGDVTMTGQGADIPAGAKLRTSRLTLDTVREQARSDAEVTLAMGRHELQARGLRADLEAGNLRLEREVHGQFRP
ncbi:MAG: LPS export ABC transporter periplasmic protein LptC [Gammaproteobacteria bacterium]|nr:LPS export ABC transporter periplasmic protein LptC [Gammaproteobacteria bacterium]